MRGVSAKGSLDILFLTEIEKFLVYVAPMPVFHRIQRFNDRVVGSLKMFGGVLVLRGVAAPDVPAGQAHSQMNPRVFRF
jgi:hypothetical protein